MNDISIKIGRWYDQNKRDLPWRQTLDPYKIWLSEIILQQTRVAQGWDYYLRFVKHFPTVKDLAKADEDEVLKLWQGLGYYSRARNLHAAARQVMECMNGTFPHQYTELKQLKGVGPYTAAAVASLSADERVAVVDGNVFRVLARLFDIDVAIDSGKGQKLFMQLATELLPENNAGHHNQAMMEMGALCCTPTSPLCDECPVADHCMALANGTIMQRPIKTGKVKVRERHFSYIIYIYNESLWVHQRGAGDIWQGLWEPFLTETSLPQPYTNLPQCPEYILTECTSSGEAVTHSLSAEGSVTPRIITSTLILQKKHQLTHQTLYADFWVCKLRNDDQAAKLDDTLAPLGYRKVSWEEWQQMAVPRLIDEANGHLSKGWF